ncbi:hypothetical protein GCM10009603_54580 [Nocardiopsis exhalans]
MGPNRPLTPVAERRGFQYGNLLEKLGAQGPDGSRRDRDPTGHPSMRLSRAPQPLSCQWQLRTWDFPENRKDSLVGVPQGFRGLSPEKHGTVSEALPEVVSKKRIRYQST